MADRQRRLLRVHRVRVDPLGRFTTGKPGLADRIPSGPRVRGQTFAETDLPGQRSSGFYLFLSPSAPSPTLDLRAL